jgi:hypothetical protein
MYKIGCLEVPTQKDLEVMAFLIWKERGSPTHLSGEPGTEDDDFNAAIQWGVDLVAYQIWQLQSCIHGRDIEHASQARVLVELSLLAHGLWWNDGGGRSRQRNCAAGFDYYFLAMSERLRRGELVFTAA